MLAAVPSCAGNAVSSVGILWGTTPQTRTCGISWATTRSSTRFPGHQEHLGNANGAARRAGPDRGVGSFSAAAISWGAIMLSRTTGTCASCYRRHARHPDEQQPGHRPAAPAHPEKALTTDPLTRPAPGTPLPPTRASRATASDHARDATDGQHAPCRFGAAIWRADHEIKCTQIAALSAPCGLRRRWRWRA